MQSTVCNFPDNSTMVYLPHVGAVEVLKPRNTRATIEVQVFIARCWATSSTTMNSLRSVPRPFVCNDSVNTLQQENGVFCVVGAEAI
jgi:hypothetical protein